MLLETPVQRMEDHKTSITASFKKRSGNRGLMPLMRFGVSRFK